MNAAAELLAFCDARGVRLAALPGGRLDIDAPRDALTPDLLARLRGHKPELLTLLAGDHGDGSQDLPGDSYEFAERAAIMEFDGGLPRPEAERLARLAMVAGDPGSGDHAPTCPANGPQDLPDLNERPERIGNAAPVIGSPTLPSDIGPTAGPEGDAPTCSACGSVRIGQGRRWRWCIDCETRIGPVITSQDLAEAVPVAIPEASTPARPGWVLPPWPPAVPDSILADLPTPCSGCGRPVGTGQPGKAAGFCFRCWQGRFTNTNNERRA